MIRIWGRLSSINVQKVVWTAVDLELDFTRLDAGGTFGGLDTPEYGQLNPNRLVPVLEDDDFVLWESNAIVRYLAERYGKTTLWIDSLPARAKADRWLDWQATTFAPLMMPAFIGLVRTPEEERNELAIADSLAQCSILVNILENELSQRPYLAGDAFSIADIAVGAQVHRWLHLPINRAPSPALREWYDRIIHRPGAVAALGQPVA